MYYVVGGYPSKLNCAVSIIFLFGAAYVHCLRFLPGQLTPIKKKHTHKENFKLVGIPGSASRPDSGLLKRGEIGGVNQKKMGVWAWLDLRTIGWAWLSDPLKEIILQHDITVFV